MLAILLLAGTMPASQWSVARVDAIEVNHFGTKNRCVQLLALDWCDSHKCYHVRAWAWYDGEKVRRVGRLWRVTWPGSAQRDVVAPHFRRTRTALDPEIEDLRLRRRNQRPPLFPSPPRS